MYSKISLAGTISHYLCGAEEVPDSHITNSVPSAFWEPSAFITPIYICREGFVLEITVF
jgi:hypothetical protein